jgi:hypothetical protein
VLPPYLLEEVNESAKYPLAEMRLAHLRSPSRRPRRLLTEGTLAAGVTRPIIDGCDSMARQHGHVGDWLRWRQLSPFTSMPAGRLPYGAKT